MDGLSELPRVINANAQSRHGGVNGIPGPERHREPTRSPLVFNCCLEDDRPVPATFKVSLASALVTPQLGIGSLAGGAAGPGLQVTSAGSEPRQHMLLLELRGPRRSASCAGVSQQ